jgi:segregation and condensation protein A
MNQLEILQNTQPEEESRHSVKLDVFEGPLELLLHLLKKNKVSIYDIPIVQITEQYFEYMNTLKEFDIEYSSEFVVIAAELLYIKSKMLLPKREDEETEDPRADLAKRLADYQRMKAVAEILKEKEFSDYYNFYKEPEVLPKREADYSDQSFETDILFQAFLAVLDKSERKAPPPKSAFGGVVGRATVSVKSRADFIRTKLNSNKKVTFTSLFEENESRPSIIATFLALLEMIKQEIVKTMISGNDIYIEKLKDGEITDEY